MVAARWVDVPPAVMLRRARQAFVDAPEFLSRLARTFGPFVRMPIPRREVCLISDPRAIEHVLIGNHGAYDKRTVQYDSLAVVAGVGLLTADDPPWKQSRRTLSPAFSSSAIGAMRPDFTAAIDDLGDRWGRLGRSTVVDLESEMLHLSLDVLSRTLFGVQWSAELGPVVHATEQAVQVVLARARNPLVRILPGRFDPTVSQLQGALHTLDAAVAVLIRHAGTAGSESSVFLERLMNLADAPNGWRHMRDEVVTHIVAGHETIASALVWSWVLLWKNPSVQEALVAESRQTSAGESGALAAGVVRETLRLYPPAWVVTRRCVAGDELPGGPIVGPDSLVLMSPWVMGRRESAWPQPTAFRPDRFSGEQGRPTGDYFPFGLGPRMCIGREMALAEGAVIVSELWKRFLMLPVGPCDPHPAAGVTLRPNRSVKMVIRRRPTVSSPGAGANPR